MQSGKANEELRAKTGVMPRIRVLKEHTRRFELLLMFLDKPRLACVARLFGALRASGAEVPASLAAAWGQK